MKKKGLVGFYNYTVILTYCGVLISMVGIQKVMHERFLGATLCLLLAGLCDMFDGAIANTKQDRTPEEKCFGMQIDSLCDLISFGAFPGLFVYAITGKARVGAVACSIYVLAALIRLSYYNVLEISKRAKTEERSDVFLGMPVTIVSIMLPAIFFLHCYGIFNSPYPFIALLLIFAVAFLVPVDVKKPGILGKIVLLILGLSELFVFFMILRGGGV